MDQHNCNQIASRFPGGAKEIGAERKSGLEMLNFCIQCNSTLTDSSGHRHPCKFVDNLVDFSTGSLQEINEKIHLFLYFISKNTELDKRTCSVISKVCVQLLEMNEASEYRKILEISNLLGPKSANIYIRRLASLVKNKGKIMFRIHVDEKKSRIRGFRMSFYSRSSQLECLSHSERDLRLNISTDSIQEVYQNLAKQKSINSARLKPDLDNEESNESKKQQFFSLCISNKLGLEIGHPGKNIPISKIYEKSIKKQIPRNKWETFIRGELINSR